MVFAVIFSSVLTKQKWLQVKERGKDVGKAYKGIRSKLRDLGDEKGKQRVQTAAAPSTSFRKDVLNKQRRSAAPDLR